jgi:hypothetical protein
VNLWRLLNNLSSSWFWHSASNIKWLNSTIVSLYLLLESSLCLMAGGWSNIIWRNTSLWTSISSCKFVLNIWHLTIFCCLRHNLCSLRTKLLTNMQSIFNDWSSVWFLITDHPIWLCPWLSFTICISTFSDILKFSLVTSDGICMVNGSVRFLVLSVPIIPGDSHIGIILEVLSNILRLPFLCNLLSTRILNVSRRKLNSVLVTSWAWISLCLHLS